MAYLALYRRYRPTSFDRLIGQNHIVKILKNQIKEDKVGHAYLFTGARGTGKTSAAKIFARAINCLTPVDGSPCGKCEVCRALSESNNMDVLEIDAASNNRVDEVRDIREKVQFPPISGRFKVYIIDEVHMLTDSAFNALLKTLEEPPSHAVFILATTEPQKLPATILSRCMRFDFRLISEAAISGLIEDIFKEIGLKYEPEAARLIARSGEGSVRDALSLADKCVSFGEGKLRYQDVLEVLGGVDRTKLLSVVKDVLTGDTGGVLTKVDELTGLGKSVSVLAKDVASVFRDMAVVMSVADANSILNYPEEKFAELKELSAGQEVGNVLRCLELFTGIEQELRRSLNPRILLETTALKCARAASDLDVAGLTQRVNRLEKELADLKRTGVRPAASAGQATQTAAVAENAGQPAVEKSRAAVPLGRQLPAEEIRIPQQPRVEKAEVKSAAKAADTGKAAADLMKALRKGTNILLFNILKTAETKVTKDTFYIDPADGNSAEYLKKPEILEQFRQELMRLGYDLRVSAAFPEERDADRPFREDMEKMKNVLGTDQITVKGE